VINILFRSDRIAWAWGGLVKKSWAKVLFYINDIAARGCEGKIVIIIIIIIIIIRFEAVSLRIIISLLLYSRYSFVRAEGSQSCRRQTVYYIYSSYRLPHEPRVDESHHNLSILYQYTRSIDWFRCRHTTVQRMNGELLLISIILRTRRSAVCAHLICETRTPFSVPTIFR